MQIEQGEGKILSAKSNGIKFRDDTEELPSHKKRSFHGYSSIEQRGRRDKLKNLLKITQDGECDSWNRRNRTLDASRPFCHPCSVLNFYQLYGPDGPVSRLFIVFVWQ